MSGRIRTLKPEWLEDERFNACSDSAIRLAIVFLSLVDDDGRVRISTKALGMAGWKWCDLIVDKTAHARSAAQELVAARWVIAYQVGEYEYWQIRTFSQHQKIDKYRPSKLPAPTAESEALSEYSSNGRRILVEYSSNGRDQEIINDFSDSSNGREESSNGRRMVATDWIREGIGSGNGERENRAHDARSSHKSQSAPRSDAALTDPRVQRLLDVYRSLHSLTDAWQPTTREGRRSRAGHILASLEGDGRDKLTAEEIELAFVGNRYDQWHEERGKHEIEYVLRSDKVRGFIATGRKVDPRPSSHDDMIAALYQAVKDAEYAYHTVEDPEDRPARKAAWEAAKDALRNHVG